MAGTGVPGDVSKRINQFFAAFRKKQIKSAYEFLLGDSELSKNKKTIETLNEGASKLLVTYGVFDGHEIIRWEYAGSRLLRIEAAAYAKSQPFRWTLYFYKSKNTWKVIDLQLSADPLAMFEKK